MTEPSPDVDHAHAVVELATALQAMRDALVELSLRLNDLQFEMSAAQRKAIEDRLGALMHDLGHR